MLDDQRSPYVGRFARGWHRLPESGSPGNHRPEREPRASIAPRSRGPNRPRRDQQGHVLRALGDERRRARGRGGSRREHVVDEEHVGGRGARGGEAAEHRSAALLPRPPGLRARVRGRSRQEPLEREVELTCNDDRERPGLVEAALGEPSLRERNPRDDAGRPGRDERHRTPEPLGDAAHASELQPVDGGARRSIEQERRPSATHRLRWTAPARGNVARGRSSAALAPGRAERDELAAARVAEGPPPRRAASAAARVQDVEHPPEHRRTLPRATDSRAGSSVSGSVRAGRRRARPRPRARDRAARCGARDGP